MDVSPERIYVSNIFVIVMFGSFLYRIGVIMEIVQQTGRGVLVAGVVLMTIGAFMGMVLRRRKNVMAVTALSCFTVAVHNWTMLPFFDNMEKAADSLASFSIDAPAGAIQLSAEQIEILRTAHLWITYAFLIIGLLAAFLAVLQLKRKKVDDIAEQPSTLIEDVTGSQEPPQIEYGRFKYCPKCLFQSEVESGVEECPECHLPLRMPDPYAK